jgi:hypothetical protein
VERKKEWEGKEQKRAESIESESKVQYARQNRRRAQSRRAEEQAYEKSEENRTAWKGEKQRK